MEENRRERGSERKRIKKIRAEISALIFCMILFQLFFFLPLTMIHHAQVTMPGYGSRF